MDCKYIRIRSLIYTYKVDIWLLKGIWQFCCNFYEIYVAQTQIGYIWLFNRHITNMPKRIKSTQYDKLCHDFRTRKKFRQSSEWWKSHWSETKKWIFIIRIMSRIAAKCISHKQWWINIYIRIPQISVISNRPVNRDIYQS